MIECHRCGEYRTTARGMWLHMRIEHGYGEDGAYHEVADASAFTEKFDLQPILLEKRRKDRAGE